MMSTNAQLLVAQARQIRSNWQHTGGCRHRHNDAGHAALTARQDCERISFHAP